MKRRKLLCVDDDSGIRELYRSMFESYGYEALVASSPSEALDLLHAHGNSFDGIISDYEMPEMNGAQLASIVKRSHPDLPFIMISGSPRDLGELSCFVDATIDKGRPVRELIGQVEAVLTPRRSRLATVSNYMSLGSALAGVASAAFLISRLLQ